MLLTEGKRTGTAMIVSAGLPTCMEGMMYPVPFATSKQVVQIAQHAEKLGYHSVWGNDHMTTQRYVREGLPKNPNFWEPLVTYAYAAARTSSIRFGTGLLITPMRRDIVVLAKQLATLDHLSGGRLIIGLGVGAYREEFEALNPDWTVNRGELLEESIQALQNLFQHPLASWHGRYYRYADVAMFPKPLQRPLPLYIGGNSQIAIRRVAAYADGWLPAGMPTDQIKPRVDQLKELAEARGRDFGQMDIAVQYITYVGKTHELAAKRFLSSQMYHHIASLRRSTLKDQIERDQVEINLVGTAPEIIEKASRLSQVGVKHLCGLYFCADDVGELKDQMQIFAEEIIPYLLTL